MPTHTLHYDKRLSNDTQDSTTDTIDLHRTFDKIERKLNDTKFGPVKLMDLARISEMHIEMDAGKTRRRIEDRLRKSNEDTLNKVADFLVMEPSYRPITATNLIAYLKEKISWSQTDMVDSSQKDLSLQIKIEEIANLLNVPIEYLPKEQAPDYHDEHERPYFGPNQVMHASSLQKGKIYLRIDNTRRGKPYRTIKVRFKDTRYGSGVWWILLQPLTDDGEETKWSSCWTTFSSKSLHPYPDGSWDKMTYLAFDSSACGCKSSAVDIAA